MSAQCYTRASRFSTTRADVLPCLFRACRRDPGDAAVLRRQASVPRRHRVFPHGRLLRDVLRGRAHRGARARADAHLSLEGCQRRRHPDVRRAVPRRRRLHRPARQEGVPRRGLRAGRGSAQGEGPRPPRSRPRRVARHADRRRLSRGARAGVPDGDRAGRRRRQGSASRCSISRPASSRPPSITAPIGRQALADELAILQPREIVAPEGFDDAAALVAAGPHRRARDLRSPAGRSIRSRRGARCSISCRRRACTGFGLDGSPGRGARRRRARPLPARHAEGRSRARPRDCVSRRRRLPARRCDHAAQSRGARGGRRRPHRIAAARDRSHDDVDGRPARCARGCCGRCVALERIQDRLDAVEELAFRSTERAKLRETLKTIHDIERLVARASLGIAGPRDLVALRQSIAAVPRVRMLLSELQAPLVTQPRRRARRSRRSARRAGAARSSTSRRRSPATAA